VEIDFCKENKLVIDGTIFQHKDIYKLACASPDGLTKKQIVHIMISKWRETLQDVRAMRGADAGTDHILML
jgi:hypothetical protein